MYRNHFGEITGLSRENIKTKRRRGELPGIAAHMDDESEAPGSWSQYTLSNAAAAVVATALAGNSIPAMTAATLVSLSVPISAYARIAASPFEATFIVAKMRIERPSRVYEFHASGLSEGAFFDAPLRGPGGETFTLREHGFLHLTAINVSQLLRDMALRAAGAGLVLDWAADDALPKGAPGSAR